MALRWPDPIQTRWTGRSENPRGGVFISIDGDWSGMENSGQKKWARGLSASSSDEQDSFDDGAAATSKEINRNLVKRWGCISKWNSTPNDVH